MGWPACAIAASRSQPEKTSAGLFGFKSLIEAGAIDHRAAERHPKSAASAKWSG